MSRRQSASRHTLLVTSLIATASLALLVAGCSGKSAGAPPATVSGPAFNFLFTATGVSHQFQFTDVGTWNYHCNTHGGAPYYMTGTVVVDASSSVDSVLVQVGAGTGFQFVPANVTIKPNGVVRWVNSTAATNHTATRP